MEPQHQNFNFIPVACIGISLVMTDIMCYSVLVPIFGATIASATARALQVGPFIEICLVALAVVGIFLVMFTGIRLMTLESKFWKHLFAEDQGYLMILQIRDIINIYFLYKSIDCLYQGIVGISEIKGMKESNLGEGIGFVFWNGLSEWGYTIPDFIKKQYSWTPDTQKASFWSWGIIGTSSFGEQNLRITNMVNGAKIVLAVAGVASFVMKLSYFTVLHTYLRAMRIFTKMQDSSPPQSRGNGSIQSVVSEYVSDFTLNAINGKTTALSGSKNS